MKNTTVAIIAAAMIVGYIGAGANNAPHAQESKTLRNSGPTRVAFVDVPTIMAQADFVQDLRKEMNVSLKKRLEQLKVRQSEYAALQEEMRTQTAVLSEEVMAEKVKKAFQIKAQVDEEKYTVEKFLKESEEKNLMPAQDHILKIVHEVAISEGYQMVFRRELLIYGSPAVDLSSLVIERLNSLPYKDVSVPAENARKP